MTDETPTEEAAPEEPQGITLAGVWAINYDLVLSYILGNTINKTDKQQYRLKAADVALALTSMEARIRA